MRLATAAWDERYILFNGLASEEHGLEISWNSVGAVIQSEHVICTFLRGLDLICIITIMQEGRGQPRYIHGY